LAGRLNIGAGQQAFGNLDGIAQLAASTSFEYRNWRNRRDFVDQADAGVLARAAEPRIPCWNVADRPFRFCGPRSIKRVAPGARVGHVCKDNRPDDQKRRHITCAAIAANRPASN